MLGAGKPAVMPQWSFRYRDRGWSEDTTAQVADERMCDDRALEG